MQQEVKRVLVFPSLFSYRSFSDLHCFLRKLTSLKLYLSPLRFLNEPPAAEGKGFPWPLRKPVNSRAVSYGWEVPSSCSQHGSDRTGTQDNLQRGGREQGEKRITGQVEATKERRAMNHGPALDSTQLRLQAKSGS